MSWLELSVRVTRQNVSLVESLLQREPVLAVTLTDDADDPVLEPRVGRTPLWPSVCLTALFDGDTPVEPLTRLLSLVPGIDRPQQVSFRKFEDQRWERAWLDRFEPMDFGHGLWVVPGQMAVPENAVHVLRMDPGLAFGTGTHPTTRLCLRWMGRHDFRAQTVIDYGCGSGVLGCVAAIKGAARVICVDNDPQAMVATRENAARNGVDNIVQLKDPEQLKTVRADVVLANILAGPLVELAPRLSACLRPAGHLVLSGILDTQAAAVAAAYRDRLGALVKTTEEGWVRLHGQRHSAPSGA